MGTDHWQDASSCPLVCAVALKLVCMPVESKCFLQRKAVFIQIQLFHFFSSAFPWNWCQNSAAVMFPLWEVEASFPAGISQLFHQLFGFLFFASSPGWTANGAGKESVCRNAGSCSWIEIADGQNISLFNKSVFHLTLSRATPRDALALPLAPGVLHQQLPSLSPIEKFPFLFSVSVFPLVLRLNVCFFQCRITFLILFSFCFDVCRGCCRDTG